jgi:hypothetical protein
MNEVLKRIIGEVDRKFYCLRMDFENASWRNAIPSEPGWYLIKTNTPITVLESVGSPKHKAHIDIPQCVRNTFSLRNLGLAISQPNNEDYVVYNGEASNLKARAREHECGHPNTYCLGLSNYAALRNYRWVFCYVAVSSCKSIEKADKSVRLAIEQGWRAVHGWPILCSR